MLHPWETLPDYMQCQEVRKYYELLQKKRFSLMIKRFLDIFAAILLLGIFALPMLMIAGAIAAENSGGTIFFRQERITAGGRIFRIHKFRTMTENSSQSGPLLTVAGNSRITKVGFFLRKYRLDEIPQLLDVLHGDMTFVGTRPEVPRYTARYTTEMYATLLLPAGITSEASILFREEDRLLAEAADPEDLYLRCILPEKMQYNLAAIQNFSIRNDICILLKTAAILW